MSAFLLRLVWLARLSALDMFMPADVPSAAIVLAIIEHESRGQIHACKNERNGRSSRGLMSWNRPHSRCSAEDNARFAGDFDPARNVRRGVVLLAWQSEWARKHKFAGDPLSLYAGRGPEAREFARVIRGMAARMEARP